MSLGLVTPFPLGKQAPLPAALAAALVVLCALTSPSARAEGDFSVPAQVSALAPLTLERAWQLANDHPDLAAAQREVEALAGQLRQSGARPNPELAYTLEDTHAATRTQTWQLSLPVELGGKRDARLAAAHAAGEAAQIDLAMQRTAVHASVTEAYLELLAAREQVALARQVLALADQSREIAGKRVEAGKVSPVEETRAAVALAGVRVDLSQAQSQQRAAELRLTSWIGPAQGGDAGSIGPLSGDIDQLPAVPTAEAIESQLATAPTLQRAHQERVRRQALAEVERTKQRPDVTMNLGVKRSNELQRSQWMLGFSVPLPVNDRNDGNLLEALRRVDKADEELRAVRLRLALDAQTARERWLSATQEAQTLRSEVVPGARSALDAAMLGFENGKFAFLDVLDAQRTYIAARVQYLHTMTEAYRAQAALARALGTPLVTTLSTTRP